MRQARATAGLHRALRAAPHRANGYSGSGVWYFSAEPIWSPQPHLCGILATECTIDKVVSGFGINTVLKFLEDNEALLLPGSSS